jgi:Metallo-beta-lactamase superfamily
MTMIFSLEALRAKHGDSLLLHFGDAANPRLIVIDGGPTGVYKDALAPRLDQLRTERGGTLPIEILMVSHLDSDHVRGVLDFSQALSDDATQAAAFPVATIWNNAFEDLAGAAAPAEAQPAEVKPAEVTAAIASVREGRRLRDNGRGLHWKENDHFDGFVMADEDGAAVDLDPLRLTIVGPRQAELDALRKEWNKKLEELAGPAPTELVHVAEYVDKSIYNLSSIVCLAEAGGKRMLLTGDARGDNVLAGLESAGLLGAGDATMELDLLKLPHHGSSRNVDADFFRRLPAKHLVVSANGKYGNPDLQTLQYISEARKDDEFTLHLTYEDFEEGVGPKILGFLAAEKAAGRAYEVAYRPTADLSLRVDLLDPPG